MTDRNSDINALPGSGRSPITNAGRVAINGHLAEQIIRERIENHRRGLTLYQGPVNDWVFTIYPREIVLEEKLPSVSKNRYKSLNPFVLSTVNAAFKKGDSLWEITEGLDFRGVAGGQGAKYDERGQNPEIDLALVQGGLITMKNTGQKRIQNNSLLYWSLPPLHDPYEKGIRGSSRMVIHTVSYEPSLDKLSEDTLGELMTRKEDSFRSEYDKEFRYPIQEGARNMKQAIMQIFLDALHTFLMSGIVKLDLKAIENQSVRQTNSTRYSNDTSKNRAEIFRKIASSLELLNIQKKSDDPNFKFKDPAPNSDREISLLEFAIDVVLGKRESSLIFPLVDGTHALPSGFQGKVVQNQKAVLSDLFSAINKSNNFVTRRIFGKALTPAQPGQDMDVLLQRYSS